MVVAVHLFLIKEDHVLLLRRYNTGYEDGKYSVVAGHLDGDERVKEAMAREAKEEAGITIEEKDLHIAGVMHRKANDERIDFFVSSDTWQGEIENMEPEKCDELAWFALDQLPENTIDYVQKALANFRSDTWFDSYGWKD
ncbi:NUDIX domain-containing protein [Geomicrobium sp. JSM 1781026]|uniref:NUDIX hydrolase n=1 Tax=unclassified Geomicrobium TaxID=2628951 RepID=UPI0005A7787E|nr:NUDIX domain-containing protein [Geomicrobium sp. JCM 19037]